VLEPNFQLERDKVRWDCLLFFALIAVPAILSSCGSSPSTVATPTITASCVPTQGTGSDVTVLGTAQCTATVVNESSTLVNWSVSVTGGGTGSAGSITSAGLYTAPSSPPTNTVTITATSQVQSTLTGTTTLTIVAATAIDIVMCLDSNLASASTVSSGNKLSCTATTSANVSVPVFWSVANANNSADTLNIGSISGAGAYLAPLVPPPGQTVTITATSQALATETKSVTVTVVFGDKVLHDSYAFSTRGRLTNANDFFARVGSFTADGGGAITVGSEDTNQAGASGAVKTQRPFTGSYSIGPDGRGTMQFCEGISTSCPAGSPSETAFFRIAVVSPQQAQIIEYSAPSTNSTSTASTTGAGEMLSQDQSVFGAGDANLSGTYSFNFYGVSSTSAFQSAIGEFTSNAHGIISAGTSAPGEICIDCVTPQTLSAATYSIDSSGRGSGLNQQPVTIGGLNFIFYVVSASHSKFIEVDPSGASILAGDAYKQQAGLNCTWGSLALSNSVVLETAGASSGVEIADVGSFTATTGNVSAGSLDENKGGTYTPATGNLTGTYSVGGCGRGNLTIGTHSYLFYPISNTNAALQENTSGIVARGFLVQSQGGPFVDGSLNGSFALRLSGTNAAGAAGRREDILGQITSDGKGKVTAGSLDINNFGATTLAAANMGTYLPDSTPATTLRAVAHLTSAPNMVLYMVSPKLFYVLETDTTGTVVGTLDNQF
jgi:hypothetical protein